jgi:hypothetical protein
VVPSDGAAHELLDEIRFPAAGAAGGQSGGGAQLGGGVREDLSELAAKVVFVADGVEDGAGGPVRVGVFGRGHGGVLRRV